MLKTGDMILYDKFGSAWPDLSPSTVPDDFGIGVVVRVYTDPLYADEFDHDAEDNYSADVLKEDGRIGTFSLSYLVDLNNRDAVSGRDGRRF